MAARDIVFASFGVRTPRDATRDGTLRQRLPTRRSAQLGPRTLHSWPRRTAVVAASAWRRFASARGGGTGLSRWSVCQAEVPQCSARVSGPGRRSSAARSTTRASSESEQVPHRRGVADRIGDVIFAQKRRHRRDEHLRHFHAERSEPRHPRKVGARVAGGGYDVLDVDPSFASRVEIPVRIVDAAAYFAAPPVASRRPGDARDAGPTRPDRHSVRCPDPTRSHARWRRVSSLAQQASWTGAETRTPAPVQEQPEGLRARRRGHGRCRSRSKAVYGAGVAIETVLAEPDTDGLRCAMGRRATGDIASVPSDCRSSGFRNNGTPQ